MDVFTSGKRKTSSLTCPFTVSIDDRGRISLPAEVRRTLGLQKGETLLLCLITSENAIMLKRGEAK